MKGYFFLKLSRITLTTALSMVLRTRSFPSFLALATISSWLDSKRYPFVSASCFALSKDELGAAAKPVPLTKKKTALSSIKAILKRMAFIVFLQEVSSVVIEGSDSAHTPAHPSLSQGEEESDSSPHITAQRTFIGVTPLGQQNWAFTVKSEFLDS